MRTFSAIDNYPVLVHCTQGKDRTGLIILILLLLALTSDDRSKSDLATSAALAPDLSLPPSVLAAVTRDYTLSESELLPERASRLEEIHEIGLTDDFAGTPADWVQCMVEHLQERFGGVRGYLIAHGVSDKELEEVCRILRV